jgi:hypothetical protein
MEIKFSDIINALRANSIHASFCARSGMTDRAAIYYNRECTCWVERDESVGVGRWTQMTFNVAQVAFTLMVCPRCAALVRQDDIKEHDAYHEIVRMN